MRRRTIASLALVLSSVLLVPIRAGAAEAPSSGYNDWTCRPSAAHPAPVVLIHGLTGTAEGHWAYLGPYLAKRGYCVYAETYGQEYPWFPVGGTRPVAESSQTIAAFIDRVLASTGTAKVSIVGHSEGGFMSLYVPKVLGYAGKVDRVVALAPPSHGTTFGNLVTLSKLIGGTAFTDPLLRGILCYACTDLITGGSAVNALVDGPIAQPGITYTIIASKWDLLVTPHETSFVREPGVTNYFVQKVCPLDPVGHIGMAFDSGVATMVTNALDPSTATRVACSFGPPL